MSKSVDRLVCVVHRHRYSVSFKVINFPRGSLSGFVSKAHSQSSFSFDNFISSFILISKSMTTNNNWLCPTLNVTRYVAHNDWLTENSSSHNVTDGSVRRFPHFFQSEFLNTCFIWSDRSTFDSYIIFFNCFSSINGYLVISRISVLNSQIVVFDI